MSNDSRVVMSTLLFSTNGCSCVRCSWLLLVFRSYYRSRRCRCFDTGSQHRFSVIFWTFLNTTRLSINLKKEATWVFYRATMFNAHYDLARTVFERLAIPWSTCHSVICIIFLACFMEPGRFLRGLVWRSNDVYLLSYGYCYFLLLAFLDVGAAQQRSDLLQCYTYACVTVVAPYVPLV